MSGPAALYHRPPPGDWPGLPGLAAAALEAFPDLLDAVPAYRSLYLEYDPRLRTADELRDWLGGARASGTPAGRLVTERPITELPLVYDGEDLPDLAAYSGLSVPEVIALHSAPIYEVRALGFVAGFPFMETTPPPLQKPRRAAPRARVPAHSVAVAGAQTGIYPVAAPGGWNLLGRALEAAYDPHREPPFLLEPGDRVRLRPVPVGPDGPPPDLPPTPPRALWPQAPRWPALRVRRAGALGLTVDGGRLRAGRFGLVRAGALDPEAAALAGALLGNPPGAALLEFHLTGPEFECLAPLPLAWSGRGLDAALNGQPLPPHSSFMVRPGDRLSFRPNGGGRVTYLALPGGLETLPFWGSASTDLRASLGRPLAAGDVFGTVEEWTGVHWPRQFTPYGGLPHPGPGPRPETLRLLPVGEGEPWPPPPELAPLLNASFRLRDLDRMAARLDGPMLTGGETVSEGCPVGTVQIPPSGEAMVLLNDKGTLGGYHKPARVHPDDLPRLVQALPGTELRFVLGQS